MTKILLEGSPVLPDIDEQIAYIKCIRKKVLPAVTPLKTETNMVFAIEQTLMAAKILTKSATRGSLSTKASGDDLCAKQVLTAVKIKSTIIRIEILKSILQRSSPFAPSDIADGITKKMNISRSAVMATLNLFKVRGLIEEIKSKTKNIPKGQGRPRSLFRYSTDLNR